MDFFRTLSEALPEGGECTIVVKKTSGQELVVAFVPDRRKNDRYIPPFIVNGSAAEIDKEIVDVMAEPVRVLTGLRTNAADVIAAAAASPAAPADTKAPKGPTGDDNDNAPKKAPDADSSAATNVNDDKKNDYATMNDLYKKGKKALAEGKKGEAWSLFNKALEFCHSEKSNAILRKSIDACGHIDDDTALFGNAVS